MAYSPAAMSIQEKSSLMGFERRLKECERQSELLSDRTDYLGNQSDTLRRTLRKESMDREVSCQDMSQELNDIKENFRKEIQTEVESFRTVAENKLQALMGAQQNVWTVENRIQRDTEREVKRAMTYATQCADEFKSWRLTLQDNMENSCRQINGTIDEKLGKNYETISEELKALRNRVNQDVEDQNQANKIQSEHGNVLHLQIMDLRDDFKKLFSWKDQFEHNMETQLEGIRSQVTKLDDKVRNNVTAFEELQIRLPTETSQRIDDFRGQVLTSIAQTESQLTNINHDTRKNTEKLIESCNETIRTILRDLQENKRNIDDTIQEINITRKDIEHLQHEGKVMQMESETLNSLVDSSKLSTADEIRTLNDQFNALKMLSAAEDNELRRSVIQTEQKLETHLLDVSENLEMELRRLSTCQKNTDDTITKVEQRLENVQIDMIARIDINKDVMNENNRKVEKLVQGTEQMINGDIRKQIVTLEEKMRNQEKTIMMNSDQRDTLLQENFENRFSTLRQQVDETTDEFRKIHNTHGSDISSLTRMQNLTSEDLSKAKDTLTATEKGLASLNEMHIAHVEKMTRNETDSYMANCTQNNLVRKELSQTKSELSKDVHQLYDDIRTFRQEVTKMENELKQNVETESILHKGDLKVVKDDLEQTNKEAENTKEHFSKLSYEHEKRILEAERLVSKKTETIELEKLSTEFHSTQNFIEEMHNRILDVINIQKQQELGRELDVKDSKEMIDDVKSRCDGIERNFQKDKSIINQDISSMHSNLKDEINSRIDQCSRNFRHDLDENVISINEQFDSFEAIHNAITQRFDVLEQSLSKEKSNRMEQIGEEVKHVERKCLDRSVMKDELFAVVDKLADRETVRKIQEEFVTKCEFMRFLDAHVQKDVELEATFNSGLQKIQDLRTDMEKSSWSKQEGMQQLEDLWMQHKASCDLNQRDLHMLQVEVYQLEGKLAATPILERVLRPAGGNLDKINTNSLRKFPVTNSPLGHTRSRPSLSTVATSNSGGLHDSYLTPRTPTALSSMRRKDDHNPLLSPDPNERLDTRPYDRIL